MMIHPHFLNQFPDKKPDFSRQPVFWRKTREGGSIRVDDLMNNSFKKRRVEKVSGIRRPPFGIIAFQAGIPVSEKTAGDQDQA